MTDPRVDAYIAAAAPFARPMLERIRAAFHAGCPDVRETLKWRHPAFERGGLLGGMSAFKAHIGLSFWRPQEMADPAGLFSAERPREASQMRLRFERLVDMPTQRVLVQYVREAVRIDANPRAPKPKPKPKPGKSGPPAAPRWFLEALRSSPRALATWEGFPPSCRREYLEWLTEAKREETRARRLAQTLEWLSEGKRRNWRYAPPRG